MLRQLKTWATLLSLLGLFVCTALYSVLFMFNLRLSWTVSLYLVLSITTVWGVVSLGMAKLSRRTQAPSLTAAGTPECLPQTSTRPGLPNRLARTYYGHREDFQGIVRRIGSPDNREKLLAKIEDELAHDKEIVRLKRRMVLLRRSSQGILCAGCIPVLLCFLRVLPFPWMLGTVVGIYLIFYLVASLAERRESVYQARRKAHLDKHSASLRSARDRDIELTNRIEEEWDTYCVNYAGYPPDWKYRVLVVLDRDRRTCTQCGWPNGVKRLRRQLHVHHVEPHSRGGDHALSNLVTLCDICHRNQEGPGHNRINPRRRKKS